MVNRTSIFIVLAVLGILALGGFVIVSIILGGAQSNAPVETPVSLRGVSATPLNTFTPTPTETPFIFNTPTARPPTATSTATATATAAPENTATPPPLIVRVPTRTPTAAPTSTPTAIPLPYKIAAGPEIDPNHPCGNQYALAGYVQDSQGQGEVGVLIRYVSKYGVVELPGVTRQGGYYELTLGIKGNEWDVYLVDANDQPTSPTVHLSTSDFAPGHCWWWLFWKRN